MKDGFIKIVAASPQIKLGDCAHNTRQCLRLIEAGARQGAKILCLPELCLTGSTCGDLFFQRTLLEGAQNALGKLLAATREIDMLIAVGLPIAYNSALYNCAAVVHQGKILGVIPKQNLKKSGQSRWFSTLQASAQITLCEQRTTLGAKQIFWCEAMPALSVGVELGEDLWAMNPPSTALALAGCSVMLNPSAHYEIAASDAYQRKLVAATAARLQCGYVSAGAGAGESSTDYVLTGHCLIAENGEILTEDKLAQALLVTELDVEKLQMQRQRSGFTAENTQTFTQVPFTLQCAQTILTRHIAKNPFLPAEHEQPARYEQILNLAALGLKQRLAHTGAKTAVVGLSGGLDSTLALLITARAFALLQRPMSDILAITMPCFGTTSRTKSNAEKLAQEIGASLHVIDISNAVSVHFHDIGHAADDLSVTFENAQARERTQVLMDVANQAGGLVIGTGDLSELALGWATYNGDHMSMYAVNAGIPKTLMRHLVEFIAKAQEPKNAPLAAVLRDILDTPVSPELLPPKQGEIAQKTEELVGPYALHDFFLYYVLRWGFSPHKVLRLAEYALGEDYPRQELTKWLENFYRRFFSQQFKRSCLPDAPKVGLVGVSPRGDLSMPSDAVAAMWLEELRALQ